MAWLGAGLVAGMSQPGTDNTSPLSPLFSWRSDRTFGLFAGLAAGLAAWLATTGTGTGSGSGPGLVAALGFALVAGLVAGLAVGLVVGLVYPRSWSSALAFVQLATSDRTPVRLMRFLEDARGRGVLRTVGPVYQFRHARKRYIAAKVSCRFPF